MKSLKSRASTLLDKLPSNSVPLQAPAPSHTDPDKEQAVQLLLQRRGQDLEYKPPSTLVRKLGKRDAEPVFSYKEASGAMLAVISEDGDVGVVDALLQMGADVNIARRRSSKIWKKITGQNQEEERSDALVRAVCSARLELVAFIAARADQASLDDAMGTAITRGDLEILRSLLDFGARSEDCHDEFLTAVSDGREEVVNLLLSGPNLPCLTCRSQALVITVTGGLSQSLQLLINTGADVDFDGSRALQAAIGSRNMKYVAMLVTAPAPPSEQFLDLALSSIYSGITGTVSQDEMESMRLCLVNGAAGPYTDRLMVSAIQRDQLSILQLIIDHSKAPPINFNDGAAAQHAIKKGQLSVLRKLLALGPSQSTLDSLLYTAMELQTAMIRFQAVSSVLSCGVQGSHVTQALISVTESLAETGNSLDPYDLSLFRLLLESPSADVNFNNGQALRLVVKAVPDILLTLIMEKRPTTKSLLAAVPIVLDIQANDLRIQRMKQILNSKPMGEVVDESLCHIVQSEPGNIALIEALLQCASVNYAHGEVFIHAIGSKDAGLVRLLMAKNPGPRAISTAWESALSIDGSQRQTFVEILLGSVSPADLNFGLLALCREKIVDPILVNILIEAGASVEHNRGACVLHAASTFQLSLLQNLSSQVTDSNIFSAAVAKIIKQDEEWIESPQIETLQYLLLKGAKGEAVHEAIRTAALQVKGEALKILADALGIDKVLFTSVYKQYTQHGDFWSTLDQIKIVDLLIRHGATDEPVAESLIMAINPILEDTAPELLVDVLLSGDADVNYKDGLSLRIAAKHTNAPLLQRLLRAGASPQSVSRAFSEVLQAGHSDSVILTMMETFTGLATTQFDVNSAFPGMDPPIFLCLERYPRSTTVISRFIDLGCDLEATISNNISDDGPVRIQRAEVSDGAREEKEDARAYAVRLNIESSMEHISLLAWAITQSYVSNEVIRLIMTRGANVSYMTPKSKMTILMQAAKYGRPELVADLIAYYGVEVAHKDVWDRSALFYAARSGHATSVAAILSANPRTDDGSLHEASREFRPDIIKLLMASGHSPNFRSAKHDGHTALSELARHGKVPDDVFIAEETIDILGTNGADPLTNCRGKTVIFLSLDNIDPLLITRLLLERLLWKSVNDRLNTFQKGDYIYSPTMYVAKELLSGPITAANQLYRLLKDHGAEDVFYAPSGDSQPDDACGMPPDLAVLEKNRRERELRRRIEDEELENTIRRDQKRAQHEADLSQFQYDSQILQRNRMANQVRQNLYLDANIEMKIQREQSLNRIDIGNMNAAFEWEQHEQTKRRLQEEREADLEQSQHLHQQKVIEFMDNGRMQLAFDKEFERHRLDTEQEGRENFLWFQDQHNRIEYDKLRASDRHQVRTQRQMMYNERHHKDRQNSIAYEEHRARDHQNIKMQRRQISNHLHAEDHQARIDVNKERALVRARGRE